MSNSISRSSFLKDLSGAPIDVSQMPQSLVKALAAQDIRPEDLAKIAGRDGKISGNAELGKLFDFVDSFDNNGSNRSFVATDASGAPTKSGALYEALKAEVAASRAVANASQSRPAFNKSLGVGTERHPVIDTNNMSPGLQDAFARVGIDPKQATGIDGRIDSAADWKRLHRMLDAADGSKDGKVTSKVRDASGAVVDSPIGELRRAIDAEVEANTKKNEYISPGSRRAWEQKPLRIESDALKVPESEQKPVDLDVPYKFQYSLYPGDKAKGDKACFEAATLQCTAHNEANFKKKERPKLAGPEEALQVAYAEDKNGRVLVDPTQARIARSYIDAQLEAGRPVVVGVSYSAAGYNNDRMTDHFVTISGRDYDAQGRLYYTYKDPGAGTDYQDGKLYVDAKTGKMFKEGDQAGGYVQHLDYEVTQVRTYAK
ncbi:MAG: hypothetical protein U1E65_15880 [Myxococcota bacterium]